MNDLNPEFFRKIGGLGGRAGKGSSAKVRSATKAIQIRWERAATAGKVILTVDAGRLIFSKLLPGLAEELSDVWVRRDEKLKIHRTPEKWLWHDFGHWWTARNFLPRVQNFLKNKKIRHSIHWRQPKPPKPNFSSVNLGGFAYRERRTLKEFLKLPFGGLHACPDDRKSRWMAAIAQAFPYRGVIVVERLRQLHKLRLELAVLLKRPIGILTDDEADHEDLVLMTPSYIDQRIIPWQPGFVIMERLPRKGGEWITDICVHYPFARHYAFFHPTEFRDQPGLSLEAAFGPVIGTSGLSLAPRAAGKSAKTARPANPRSLSRGLYRPKNPELEASYGSRRWELEKRRLAERLEALRSLGVQVGTGSWNQAGWLGTFFAPSRYLNEDQYSPEIFKEQSLSEYASIFTTVIVRHGGRKLPTNDGLQWLSSRAPKPFEFVMAATQNFLYRKIPKNIKALEEPYSKMTRDFLNADRFIREYLAPCNGHLEQIGFILMDFPEFPPDIFKHVLDFVLPLESFLDAMPKKWRFAVQVRNPEFLSKQYFDCLRKHRAAHVFDCCLKMPSIEEQMAMVGNLTADFSVCRLSTPKGDVGPKLENRWEPFRWIQRYDHVARAGAVSFLEKALHGTKRRSFLLVEDTLEGHAPTTILHIIEQWGLR